jgi:hypothetical protein
LLGRAIVGERGRWKVNEETGDVEIVQTSNDYVIERTRRIELEERERLVLVRPSIVKGATR